MGADGRPIDLFSSPQLRHIIAHPEAVLELVTHPGTLHDPEFPPDTLLTNQRQWEYDFLLSPQFKRWLGMMEAKIINYGAIIRKD
jgi:hypothetical protein